VLPRGNAERLLLAGHDVPDSLAVDHDPVNGSAVNAALIESGDDDSCWCRHSNSEAWRSRLSRIAALVGVFSNPTSLNSEDAKGSKKPRERTGTTQNPIEGLQSLASLTQAVEQTDPHGDQDQTSGYQTYAPEDEGTVTAAGIFHGRNALLGMS
jgi:hypothetical protein